MEIQFLLAVPLFVFSSVSPFTQGSNIYKLTFNSNSSSESTPEVFIIGL